MAERKQGKKVCVKIFYFCDVVMIEIQILQNEVIFEIEAKILQKIEL